MKTPNLCFLLTSIKRNYNLIYIKNSVHNPHNNNHILKIQLIAKKKMQMIKLQFLLLLVKKNMNKGINWIQKMIYIIKLRKKNNIQKIMKKCNKYMKCRINKKIFNILITTKLLINPNNIS